MKAAMRPTCNLNGSYAAMVCIIESIKHEKSTCLLQRGRNQ